MSSSQNSRSSRSRTSAIRGEVMCWHGERAVLRTSGTKENPGRRFWGCVRYEVQESCGFFKWADTVQAPAATQEPAPEQEEPHVARLRRKISCQKAKIKEAEMKLKFVAALGFVGWLGLLYVWMNKNCNAGHGHGLGLRFG